jgi:co-chaperonin GroES (HSP10)
VALSQPSTAAPNLFVLHDTGDIVAVGDGRVGGTTQTFDLKVGETILYSKFGIGVTDIEVQGNLHILIREDDVIGTMPRSGATAADIPELKPAGDRVLIKVTALTNPSLRLLAFHNATPKAKVSLCYYKFTPFHHIAVFSYNVCRHMMETVNSVSRRDHAAHDGMLMCRGHSLRQFQEKVAMRMQVQESAAVTAGGVLLPDSAKEKPIAGIVVRVGPGKREKDGSRKTPKLKEGDKVMYFKWAGDNMETPSGENYVVVHESDVLCKV